MLKLGLANGCEINPTGAVAVSYICSPADLLLAGVKVRPHSRELSWAVQRH